MPGPRPQYPVQLTQWQVSQLRQHSLSYTAPYAQVQRVRILLLAYHHPQWTNTTIAQRLGCARDMVPGWRRRWQAQGSIDNRPRPGAPRRFSSLMRVQVIALACSKPAEQGKGWKRWSGEKLAQVAMEKGIVPAISASTIRRWLRQDRIKPWRYHSWQPPADPQFVEKASPVLELYAQARDLVARGEGAGCLDEKTSLQARQRLDATKGAVPGHPVPVADRYRRMGAVQLFCALMVATGLPFARCYRVLR